MSHGYKTQQLGLGMKKVVFCEEKSIVGGIKHVFKLFDNHMYCRLQAKFIG